MARIILNAIKGGIDRQRTEGSPSPNVLFQLLNGYRNAVGKLVSRQGSRAIHSLPAGATKGFCVFNDEFVVFSHLPQTVPSGVTCEVLVHPTDPTLALAKIHFAGPFLRFLYVVAEFTNGDVFHYWLRSADTWTENTPYSLGFTVQPTVPNGFVYVATRLGDPRPLWAPNVARTVGDEIEPTTPDGFYYEVVDAIGTAPRSGATEPTWNAEDGALTVEDVDTGPPPPPTPTGPTGGTQNPDPGGVYTNPSGSRPNNGSFGMIEQ